MEVHVGPTGHLVQGSIFDCNKKKFIRAIKDYDKQLYLKWNPKKNKGFGCWELRRYPSTKTPVFGGRFEGVAYYRLEHVEQDLIHHIMDMPYLTYQVVDRLKEMDAWENKRLLTDGEEEAERLIIKEEDDYRAERQYQVKQDKKYWKEYLELVRSGYNPFWFFR